MKTSGNILAKLLLLSTAVLQVSGGFAQGTAFTYQGRLNDGGMVANGSYDLRFTIYDLETAGAAVAGPLTNSPVMVSNGVFTAMLDFGVSAFPGADRFLEIAVRTNGGGAFTPLMPRQPLTPTPYAIFARGVNATGISGTITSNMLAPGAAAANLAGSGQAAVPSGGMILSFSGDDPNLLNAGYVKIASTAVNDIWALRTNANAPAARGLHTAVWNGSQMIVWGGVGTNLLNTGGYFDVLEDAWFATSTNGAPAPRYQHTAVWTDAGMIIWGGYNGSNYFGDGYLYDPGLNSWTPLSTNGAPSPRSGHTAVWTGTQMIVWGGYGGSVLGDGARYDPLANTWTSMNTPAIIGRTHHTAVWTGTEMIVWGGSGNFGAVSNGARYNPVGNNWTTISSSGAPVARYAHTAVWTGSHMIVWGGFDNNGYFNSGGRYSPVSNNWAAVTTNAAPAARQRHTTVWTGTEMLVRGGSTSGPIFNDGSRYHPGENRWRTTTTIGAPSERDYHTAVWTGTNMIIWGGSGFELHNDLFVYTLDKPMFIYLKQ